VSADRPLAPLLLASLACVGGAALVLLAMFGGADDAGVALLIAVGLVVTVRVPWGGFVPMGGAAVIAAAALLTPLHAAATLTVGLMLGGVLQVCRVPRPAAIAAVNRYASSIVGAFVSVAGTHALMHGSVPTLVGAIAASVGLVVGDIAAVQLVTPPTHRFALRSAVPVHLTLACAGALVAVAVAEVGVAMAAVAAFPLLITRFSFDRYAGATDTLDQTVQALGLVPELAGIVPLGHSERSAAYAVALCRELGFDRRTTTRVVTATRLHHLGAVPFEDDAEHTLIRPGEIAAAGARILREAGFPADVAALLESANADALDAQAHSLEAAVVRTAATFDEIVGEDPDGADRGLALVSGAARDPHSRRAAAALLELIATRDDLVRDAVAAGDHFRDAAVGLDLDAVTAARGGAGELLPFARRA
jgi:hypothetical protein